MPEIVEIAAQPPETSGVCSPASAHSRNEYESATRLALSESTAIRALLLDGVGAGITPRESWSISLENRYFSAVRFAQVAALGWTRPIRRWR
jgi:hypothetical protein